MVVHHGPAKPGDRVYVAEGVTMTDDEGNSFWSPTGEFREGTVVDDTPPVQPGS
jgi:hypothetical protein